MTDPVRFDAAIHTVGLSHTLEASLVPATPDPAIPVDGVTIGVASMSESSPHGGEMHPDGDEVLYLISGRVRVALETSPPGVIEMVTGDGMIVPKGVWHRVDILEPSQIVYVTPGPNNEYRPLGYRA